MQHENSHHSVLVLGASSLIGRYLLPQLVALDSLSSVHALSRKTHASSSDRTIWHQGDLNDNAGVLQAMPVTIDALISLAPIWVLADFLDSAASEKCSIERIVAFSSTSVFSKPDSRDSKERELAARLGSSEQRLQARCKERNIALTLLRPTLIYDGISDQNITRIANLLVRFPFFPLARGGKGQRSPVHAADLAVAVVAVLQTPATAGQTYNLMGGENLSYRAMVERIAAAAATPNGRKLRFVTLPDWSLTLVALLRGVPVFSGINTAMLQRMGDDLLFDDSAARADFAWHPRHFEPVVLKLT